MLRRYIKYGAISTFGLGFLVNLHRHEYQIDSFAVVRASKAVVSVGSIAWTYKSQLYNRKLDKKSDEYIALKSKVHEIAANKLLDLCIANKGVYIKVGQHIGALDYLLPSEYVQTMKVLHKDAPSNSVEMLNRVIKEDLKKDPHELFESFDPLPLGTASLAQVHKAKLKDGRIVAIKVQHYFVRKNVKTDIKTMESLVKVMSWMFPDFQMQWLVDETKKNIFRELDFENEGHNAEKMAEMFKNYKWLKVPKIYWDYTTKRILTMEFIEGGQVNDTNYIKQYKIDPFDLSRKLGDLYSHMIFVQGFVHSDPHPGNILVRKLPNEKETIVYLLDHGLYADLSDKFRYDYSQLWLGIINRDRASIKKYAGNLGIKGDLYGLFACIVSGRPWESIEKGISNIKPNKEEKKKFQTQLPDFINQITQCLQDMDRQALLVLKTNDLIRSIEYSLGTESRMSGFTVMTKCCLKSVYNEHYKNCKTTYEKLHVVCKNIYSLLSYYIFLIGIELRFRFLL